MDGISFFIDCNPPRVSHHAKRIVRRGKFSRLADAPELTSARETLLTLLKPHQPQTPLDGPLQARFEWTWPWLGGDSAKTRARGRTYHDTKPDLSNVTKTLEDCLAALLFFTNDSRIVLLKTAKWRGDQPGILVELWRLR